MKQSNNPVYLVWNAGKDAFAGNRLVKEFGPIRAVHELAKTFIKADPSTSEFEAVNMASNILQYHIMLAKGNMPCHATRQRVNKAEKQSLRELETFHVHRQPKDDTSQSA